MYIVRSATGSSIKLDAIREAWANVWPEWPIRLMGLAVELRDRADLQINAQPEGRDQTLSYVRARWYEMCRIYGPVRYLDVVVESGAIDNRDVAVVGIYTVGRQEVTTYSQSVPFPHGVLAEARRRGFKTTTAGDIIHERWDNIPANDWQGHFPPYIARKTQIRRAVESGLRKMELPQ